MNYSDHAHHDYVNGGHAYYDHAHECRGHDSDVHYDCINRDYDYDENLNFLGDDDDRAISHDHEVLDHLRKLYCSFY